MDKSVPVFAHAYIICVCVFMYCKLVEYMGVNLSVIVRFGKCAELWNKSFSKVVGECVYKIHK